MNREKILEMIRPFVKSNCLSYEEFEKIFCGLSQKEKYLIADFLNDDLNILLVDEEDFATTRENFQFVDYVLSAVKPYIENHQLTYEEFDEIFSKIDKRKQYAAADILAESDISLVDEKILPAKIESLQGNFPPQPEDIIPRKENQIKASNSVLVRLAQNGDRQALRDLLVKNRGLVLEYAAKYSKIYKHSLSAEDLEQAGRIGMLTAIEKFNLSYGTQFSTYAVWWIKQAILRTIYDEGFTIRLPVHMFEKINKAVTLDDKFCLQEENFSVRVGLIAKEMGISNEEVRELFLMRNNYLNIASLDVPIGEESDTELVDFIEDYVTPSPYDVVSKKIFNETIEKILNTLTEREKQVIILRFGIYDGNERTLEEIGNIFHLTRERIRQIESKALKKLRKPPVRKKLKEWLF